MVVADSTTDTTASIPMRAVTTGLRFPEGSVALRDGGVLLVEIRRGTLAGADSRTAWITSSGRGILYTLDWPSAGLDLAFTA